MTVRRDVPARILRKGWEFIVQPSVATPEPATTEKRTQKKVGKKEVEKLEEAEADPDRPRIVRSLALTSERLGLTAKLDLAEIEGTTAVPVDYRKGKPKRPWQVIEATGDMMESPQLLLGPD